MSSGKRWGSNLVLLSITFIWGATFVMVQDAIATLPPLTFVAIRFALAALLLLLPLLFRRQGRVTLARLFQRTQLIGGFVLGVWLFLGYALQTFSLLYTTSGKAGFLTGLSVTLVPLLAWPILRVKPTRIAIIGVLLATIGLYLLAFVDLSKLNPGDLLAFLCAIAFALQVVYTGKYSTQEAVQQLVVIQLATVAGLSAIAALLFEPWQHVLQSGVVFQPQVVSALIVTAVFATSFAFLAQTHIQQYMTATNVALIFACEPIFAALADLVWNGVVLGPRALFGCALILCGMLLSELPIPWHKIFRRSRGQTPTPHHTKACCRVKDKL
jgi:drug/metabolite transporter (DMT)-like permease